MKGKTRAKFLVTDDVPSSRLSGRTCEELKFLSFKRELLVRSVLYVKALSKDVFLSEYNNVFTGRGDAGNYKIERPEGAVPRRNVP